MLGRLAGGAGLLGLAGVMQQKGGSAFAANPSLNLQGNLPARAKRVIFLFLNGGPSHVDTFDPKPALLKHEGQKPAEKLYRDGKKGGFMPSPFKFTRHGESGLEFSESVSHLAKLADDVCIVRSMHTDVPNHEPALLQMHTGVVQPTRPSLGSWALYGLGSENENLPGYVVLRPSPRTVVGPALWSNGFLPARYQATSIITREMAIEKLLPHIKSRTFDYGAQRRQLNLLGALNEEHLRERGGDAELEADIRAMETAYAMQMEATEALDLSGETKATREMYGTSRFANSCLLARRLAERGVRFTTVYYTNDKNNQPWDTHKDHNEGHKGLCADADRAAAGLIEDLKQRGLLDDTLVIFGGEFGRTPFAEQKKESKPGRDHHSTAFSYLLAGGGVQGGFAYGSSDEFGMHVQDNPMHVHDFHATVLHLLGIEHEQLTYHYAGRDFRLTDVHGKVATGILQ
jgi:hypothetical protein